LQTEKDKERLADGLISAAPVSGFNKNTLVARISSLKKREFLLHNIHNDQMQLFHTRWALSYLAGPLTRSQIKVLAGDGREKKYVKVDPGVKQKDSQEMPGDSHPPVLPAMMRQDYALADIQGEFSRSMFYRLHLLATADVSFINNRYGIIRTIPIAYVISLDQSSTDASWLNAKLIDLENKTYLGNSIEEASYMPVQATAFKLSVLNSLDKQFEGYVYRNYNIALWKSNVFKLISLPDESERDFRIRLRQASQERKDLEIERIRRQFAKKVDSLEKQLETARRQAQREGDQYQQKMLNTAISVGSSIFGAILGGRASRTGIARAARSATGLGKEKRDIARAKEKMSQIQDRINELDEQLIERITEIAEKFDPMNEELQKIVVQPKKSDILQRSFGFLWVPYARLADGTMQCLNRRIK
jgi:hypothetical protein